MKIAIIGYGKLGKTLEKMCANRNFQVSFIIHSKNTAELSKILPENTDVAIEISTPQTAYANCETLIKAGVTTLCGTTGWQDKVIEIEQLANQRKVGFLYASNFSTGVNLFFLLNQYLARLMDRYEEYEIEAEEWHHIHKKDAPSGTAVTLLQDILKEVKRKDHFGLLLGPEASNPPSKINVLAHREGEIPGIHQITYSSDKDAITIQHRAKSREAFAHGALKMAQWLRDKKGSHPISEYLGLY
jgi:4-hydroxy-tetrahydrodipicolinate reductase